MANTYDIVDGDREDTADNTTYIFNPTDTLKTFSLAGNSDGDTIAIEALSSDFKVRFKKNEMILTGLKGTPSAGVIVKVQMDKADGGVGHLTFLDGTVDVTFEPNSPGATKGSWTFGGENVGKKINLSSESVSYAIDATHTYGKAEAAAKVDLNSVNYELTTNLDDVKGDASNEVITGFLNDTFEDDDSVDGGEGTDTLVLYATGSATVDTQYNTINSIERVVLQGRYGNDANVNMDLVGVNGLEELEIRNFIGGESDINIQSAPGTVLVEHFDNDDNNINVNFADSVANAEVTLSDVFAGNIVMSGDSVETLTINADGLSDNDGNDNSWVRFEGSADSSLESVVVNVTADSWMGLDFNNESDDEGDFDSHPHLTSMTINADADLTGWIDFANDANGNDVTTSLTINGSGDVKIDGIWEDDNLNIVYTGSGSLELGVDLNSNDQDAWEPLNGSFNASSATGDVAMRLDLNESDDVQFSFVGSKGDNTVYINEWTAYNGVMDGNDEVDPDASISIAAGSGHNDTLVIYNDDDVAEHVADIYSGFETLRVEQFGEDGDGNQYYDLSHVGTDFKSLELVYRDDNNYNWNDDVEVVVNSAVAKDISLIDTGEDSYIDLTLTLDAAVGTADEMVVNFVKLDNLDIEDNTADYADEMYINNVEEITLNSTGAVTDENGNEQWNSIGEFYADAVRTLTITGDVSFSIDDNLNANELYLIDATGFSGESLYIEDIDTDRSLEYRGSATADQNISFDGFGLGLVVTTGSGDDNINIDSDDNWSSVEVDLGGGDDWLRLDMNNDVDSDGATAVVTLGAGADEIVLDDIFDGNIDANFVAEITDFDVTEDELWLDDNNNNLVVSMATDQDGDYNVTAEVDNNDRIVLVFDFDADHNDLDFGALYAAGDLDGNDLLEALAYDLADPDNMIIVDSNSDGYLVAYNSGDAYVFAFEDDGSGALDGNDIVLVGVLDDVAVGSLTASNIALYN